MSTAFRGQGERGSEARPLRTPLAQVSRGALVGNARSSGAEVFSPTLLRADAWGHGLDTVTAVLDEAGLVSAVGDASSAHALTSAVLFGLPSAPGSVPALRLIGTVLATKDLRAHEGVSYGYLFRAPADTRIALITGGYAQGVVRSLGNSADVVIAGRRYPIIGRVAMDVCMIEIADAEVHRGDEAVFFGDPRRSEPSLGEWSRSTGLSAGELVAAVGLHCTRQVIA